MGTQNIAHIGHSFQHRQTSRAYKPLKWDVYPHTFGFHNPNRDARN